MATPLKIKAFDAAEFLDTDAAIAAFLADALNSGDSAVFQEALQTAARARGMSEVADAAGLGRESLYKALRPDSHPRFDTVQKVVTALGGSFTISVPKRAAKRKAAPKTAEKVRVTNRDRPKAQFAFAAAAGKPKPSKAPSEKLGFSGARRAKSAS